MKKLLTFIGIIALSLTSFKSSAQLTVNQSVTPTTGLKVGDKILTSLHLHPAMNDRIIYTVYSYKLIAD